MKFSSEDPLAMYEQLAAESLSEQGEVVHRDNHDHLDQFSDAALADQLVTAWAGRLGKLDFGRLVEAFGRMRSEGVSVSETPDF